MKISRLINAAAAISMGAFLTSAQLAAATSPMVVAYVPNWASLSSMKDQLQYDKLTHINVAFKNPDGSGNLSYTQFDKDLIAAAHAKGVKVFVSLGGASTASNPLMGTYKTQLSSANRANFVAKIKNYLVTYNFDGVDIDIEGPGISGVANYGPFISDLAAALHQAGKGVSSALSEGYGAKDVLSETLKTFDFINIMSYDGAGPWSGPGQHSSMDQAIGNINYFSKRGVVNSKLVLGVPFYGYGWGNLSGEWSYKNIVAKYSGAENVDSVGSGSNIIYYNGIPTIKKKAQLSIDNGLAGVMFWEMSQDATGAKSLLSALYSTLHPTGTTNRAPVVSAGADVSITLSSASSASITLSGSVTDADGDATSKLWTKVSGPGAVNFNSPGALTTNATITVAGTYVLRLAADDAHGHYVVDDVQVVVNPYINPPTTFTRRINMNGAGSTIGGNTWTAYSTALTQGLSITPAPALWTASKAFAPVPAVDAATASMLNTAIWSGNTFTINQNVPKGNYSVSLWLMENYATNHRSFNVSMEGVTKALGIGQLAYGTWKKYTYSTTVTDGQLNITLSKVANKGEPGVMGLEIVSVSSIASLDFENVLGSWAQR